MGEWSSLRGGAQAGDKVHGTHNQDKDRERLAKKETVSVDFVVFVVLCLHRSFFIRTTVFYFLIDGNEVKIEITHDKATKVTKVRIKKHEETIRG